MESSVCVQCNMFFLDITLLILCNTIGVSSIFFALIALICLTKISEVFFCYSN